MHSGATVALGSGGVRVSECGLFCFVRARAPGPRVCPVVARRRFLSRRLGVPPDHGSRGRARHRGRPSVVVRGDDGGEKGEED